jgi:hypothetical protein
MITNETLSAKGSLKIEVFNPDGSLKEEVNVDNLVVTVGKNFIASRIVGVASSVMSHMAVGTGAVAPVVGNTTLGAESARVALTSGTSSGAIATFVATFPAGTATAALTEAGIFNAASAGTMLCRTVFAVVNKGASDAMTITWTVTVS